MVLDDISDLGCPHVIVALLLHKPYQDPQVGNAYLRAFHLAMPLLSPPLWCLVDPPIPTPSFHSQLKHHVTRLFAMGIACGLPSLSRVCVSASDYPFTLCHQPISVCLPQEGRHHVSLVC